ncbi:MAG: SAM-dependent methyltransferase, partial [Nanoarchaeota archaeon]
GFKLIRECIKENILVSPLPGGTALIPAITASGLPTDKFTFYGFLPKSEKKKKDLFNIAIDKNTTAIFYESPHRIIKTCEVLKNNFPSVNISIARELTKKFEEFIRGSPAVVLEKIPEKPKGEFVLVVSGKEK